MATLSRRQTLEQQRAAKAWELVSSVTGDPRQRAYNSWVKKVPVLILTNGLGQTCAFLKSKSDHEKQLLYDHLAQWLKANVAWSADVENEAELIERLIHESSQVYRWATLEALAFLNWLRRFADALLEKGDL